MKVKGPYWGKCKRKVGRIPNDHRAEKKTQNKNHVTVARIDFKSETAIGVSRALE